MLFPAKAGGIGRSMDILAVSSNEALLAALENILAGMFPEAVIARAADPLMAGKYAFHNKVDLLLAEVEMKRMNGVQLIRFVRQEQPAVRAYLMGRADTLRRLPPNARCEAAGLIELPLTAEKAAAALDGAVNHEEGRSQ